MDVEITPEPSDGERAAILAALAQELLEQERARSAWADELLPQREQPLGE